MRTVLAAVALSFAATAAGPHDEIPSLLNEFLAKVDDVAMHERFWADDLVYVSAKGEVRSKAAILQSMRAGDTPGVRERKPGEARTTYSAEEVKVRPVGAGVAMLNFRLVQHVGDKANYFRNSGTLVKRDGRWQVVSWQATREEPPSTQ
jgi:Domain of unknown function (DUF4440)